MLEVEIEASWMAVLREEFQKPYFLALCDFYRQERGLAKTIFPPTAQIFAAFHATPFKKVKVVILGQDPYHGEGQAMGLSFSVPKAMKIPPSLTNIYKELHHDLGVVPAKHGDLTAWTGEGVFLLNAMLSVEKNKAGSHQNCGWQNFTNCVISTLSKERENLVFMLWGNFAKQKKILIDPQKHLILEAAHPSPLAGGAFFGSKPFSKANEYLKKHNKTPIKWEL